MKRTTALVLTAIFTLAIYAMAGDQRDNQKISRNKQSGPVEKPVVINMNRPLSGGHDRNYPSQQKQNPIQQPVKQAPVIDRSIITPNNNTRVQDQIQQKQRTAQRQITQTPIYGKLQLAPKNKTKNRVRNNTKPSPANHVVQSDANVVNVVHHHPYEPNYVRKKLQKIGVVSAPGYIVNRDEIIDTDRAHSKISYPKESFDKRPLNASPFSFRNFNDKTLRSHMKLINDIDWQNRVHDFNRVENRPNNYYWHKDNQFNYCHYIDNSGYHWYGWYFGDRYFWTRIFNNRWWWYDADFDRWCFWNDGFWWWQDPYHMGDLYCYNNTTYIPCNSAEDSVAVVVPDNVNTHNFTSPDNTRIIKVVDDTQDAFLYDAAKPPAFNPVYLASGVQDVFFSDPKNGRPLEIILKLNDQSFDMFDADGNPYNSASSESDQ